MNVSMMDTWNLGWKLAMVLRGQASPEILKTCKYDSWCCWIAETDEYTSYTDQSERQATAQELIDFDHHWSRLLGAKNVTGEEMDRAWKKSMKFTSGTGVVYKPSLLVEQEVERASKLASNIQIGSVSASRVEQPKAGP